MVRRRKRWIAAGVLGAAVLAAVLLYRWRGDDIVAWITASFSRGAPPVFFLLMFLLLPLLGFPISVFLVLLGLKFGWLWGVVILFAGIAAHLLAAFSIANSFLRDPIQRKLVDLGYRLPQVPRHRRLWFSCLFMAVPGLPYAVKNYALALCGVPFGHYFFSGFVFQGTMGVPFVIAGEALAAEQMLLLLLVVVGSGGLMAMIHRIKARTTKRSSTRRPATEHPED